MTFASGKWHKMMFLNVDGVLHAANYAKSSFSKALLRDAVKALVDQDTVEDRHSRRRHAFKTSQTWWLSLVDAHEIRSIKLGTLLWSGKMKRKDKHGT